VLRDVVVAVSEWIVTTCPHKAGSLANGDDSVSFNRPDQWPGRIPEPFPGCTLLAIITINCCPRYKSPWTRGERERDHTKYGAADKCFFFRFEAQSNAPHATVDAWCRDDVQIWTST